MGLSWDEAGSNLEEMRKDQQTGNKQGLNQATRIHRLVLSLEQRQRIKYTGIMDVWV